MVESELLERLKTHIVHSTAMLQRKSNGIAMGFATDRFNPRLLGDIVAFDESVQLMLDQVFHSLDNLLSRLVPSQETGDLCRAVLGIRKNLTAQLHTFEHLAVACGLTPAVQIGAPQAG
jgi:hypothetical protein